MPTIALTVSVSADAVAWYAAIVATLSAAASGYAVWRDRTRIKVSARPNMHLTEPTRTFSVDEDLIFIQAANVGRRPVNLGMVWFEEIGLKQGAGRFVKSNWEPAPVIKEGESTTMLCRQKDLDIAALKSVVVKDATGRMWYGRVENK